MTPFYLPTTKGALEDTFRVKTLNWLAGTGENPSTATLTDTQLLITHEHLAPLVSKLILSFPKRGEKRIITELIFVMQYEQVNSWLLHYVVVSCAYAPGEVNDRLS